MRLWLVLRNPPTGAIAPPTTCPHPGCDGRRFRVHQVVSRRVRHGADAASFGVEAVKLPAGGTISLSGAANTPPVSATVTARRYRCLSCRRTFRVYPSGIDRGAVPAAFKRFAAALRWLGLPVRDISRAFDVLGMPFGKSQVHVAVGAMVRGLRQRSREAAPLCGHVEIEPAGAAATIEIGGRRLPLRRAVDWAGRPALVIEGIDSRVRAIVERTVRPVLAGFGVIAEVDYSEPGRSSLDDLFGSGQSSSGVFGADQVDQVEGGAAAESTAGESGAGAGDGAAGGGEPFGMAAAGTGPPGAMSAGPWEVGRGYGTVSVDVGTGRRARLAGEGMSRGALGRGEVGRWAGRGLGIWAIGCVAGVGDGVECRDRGAELLAMGCRRRMP